MAIVKFNTPKPGSPRTAASINEMTGAIASESGRLDRDNLRQHGLDSTTFRRGSAILVHPEWFKTLEVHAPIGATQWEVAMEIPLSPTLMFNDITLGGPDLATYERVVRIRASSHVRVLPEGARVGMAVGFEVTGSSPLVNPLPKYIITNTVISHGGLKTGASLGNEDIVLTVVGAITSSSFGIVGVPVEIRKILIWIDSGSSSGGKLNKYFDIAADVVSFQRVADLAVDATYVPHP